MNIINQWAGHFQSGGSDKVWGAAFTADGQFLSRWGRRGAALQNSTKQYVDQEAASKEFTTKVRSKVKEGYQQVPFDDIQYGLPSFGATSSNEEELTDSFAPQAFEEKKMPVYQVSYVTPLSWEILQECLQQEAYGVTEKVNGERCLIAYTEQDTLLSYNRTGVETALPPLAAQALRRLIGQFVVDGERLTGDVNGDYVVFDLLEWQGKDIRAWPYRDRICLLEQEMERAGLIVGGGATYALALANSLTPGLTVLTPAQREHGIQAIDAIVANGGEGVIVRTLDAPYEGGRTKQIRKFKFLEDIDAIVIGVNPGKSSGSVQLGLVRSDDGAIIEIGNVRSGLNDQAITRLAEMLMQGEHPVLTVKYLPIRTIGITLVEPKTNMKMLRTDKKAQECTTDQFSSEKGPLIAAAKVVRPSLL